MPILIISWIYKNVTNFKTFIISYLNYGNKSMTIY
jgi:hypothetical protein